jgi:hypothetical protein
MNWPYLHTLVNHFPIVLVVIGALAILLATIIEKRALWMYALATLTLAGITVYPAWLTGGRAADTVQHAWYIAPYAIHDHSQAAALTLWIVGATGLLALVSLITLLRAREALSPAKGFRILVGIGALASICSVAYTGYLGGQIVVESPILKNATPPAITPSVTPLNPTGTSPSQPPQQYNTVPPTSQPQIQQQQQQQQPLQTQPQTQSPIQPPTQPPTQPQSQSPGYRPPAS